MGLVEEVAEEFGANSADCHGDAPRLTWPRTLMIPTRCRLTSLWTRCSTTKAPVAVSSEAAADGAAWRTRVHMERDVAKRVSAQPQDRHRHGHRVDVPCRVQSQHRAHRIQKRPERPHPNRAQEHRQHREPLAQSVWGGATSGRRRFGDSRGLRTRRWQLPGRRAGRLP